MCDCKDNKQPERKPHVHAELIKLWAEGAQMQYLDGGGDWQDTGQPSWALNAHYRVKPEPKPLTDLEKYGVEVGDMWLLEEASEFCNAVVTYVSTRVWYKVIGNGKQFNVPIGRSLFVDGDLLFRRGVVNKL